MKKIILSFLAILGVSYASTAVELAHTIKNSIIPKIDSGKMSDDEVSDFFTDKVFDSVGSKLGDNSDPSDAEAYLRMVSDSLGGGSLNHPEVKKEILLSVLSAENDLSVVKKLMQPNSTDADFKAYGKFMYDLGIWPKEFLGSE